MENPGSPATLSRASWTRPTSFSELGPKAYYALLMSSKPELFSDLLGEVLEPTGQYRFLDSVSRIGIVHKQTNTRLRVISSSGKSAMGLVGTPWAVCDEPGSWETNGGMLMWDALATARGKPGSPLKILLIGTLAPAVAGWWHDLIEDGTNASTFVMALRGDPFQVG